MLCVVYSRQSRRGKSTFASCEAQRAICLDFASEHRWQVADERFDDRGASSETLDRPALQRLLKLIEEQSVDRVIVYAVDRLTRRLIDLSRLLEMFAQADVLLTVVTDPHFGETAANRLMSNVVAAASQFQQEITRERMAESRAALKRKGRRVAGRVPFGYLADPQTKQLVVDQPAAQVVRRIFRLAAGGNLPTEIAQIADEEGWATGPWSARRILKLLSNPTYTGDIRDGDGTLPGQHTTIVTRRVFDQARDQVQKRRSRTPGRSAPHFDWPLRGILMCGRCGRRMSPSVSGYRNLKYRYYRCRSTAGDMAPCRGVCASAFEIEEFVRSMVGGQIGASTEDEKRTLADFRSHWDEMSPDQQRTQLSEVLSSVNFDPDGGVISVELNTDCAGSQMVE